MEVEQASTRRPLTGHHLHFAPTRGGTCLERGACCAAKGVITQRQECTCRLEVRTSLSHGAPAGHTERERAVWTSTFRHHHHQTRTCFRTHSNRTHPRTPAPCETLTLRPHAQMLLLFYTRLFALPMSESCASAGRAHTRARLIECRMPQRSVLHRLCVLVHTCHE